MTKQTTKVRHYDHNDTLPWVVDIESVKSIINGYVQPDGTAGSRYNYDTKEEAEDAEKLFHEKQKTSAGEEISVRKETNPKDVIGMKKAPLSTLSGPVLFEMGLGMLEGARKYGRHNYRAAGVSASVYYDAATGHLVDWFEGEDLDPDSRLNHVTKAITTLLVLRDSMLMGNWIDDRPLRNPNKLYKKHFNLKAKEIIERYPDSEEPYLEIRKDTPRGG